MSKVVMLLLNSMTADARVEREASALAAGGYEVTVCALRESGLPLAEERDGYTIRRVAEYTTASPRDLIGKLRQSHGRARSLAAAALGESPGVIHAHDSDTLLAGLAVVRQSGARFVYDAHELYPDMAGPDGTGRSAWSRAYWRRVERRCVPRADATITVGEGLARVLRERYGVDPVVVKNVSPLRPHTASDRLRSELGIAESQVIFLYQGVVNLGRGLDVMVQAFEKMPEGAVLVVQGAGSASSQLESLVDQAGITDRVFLMGHVPMTELHEYASSADVGVAMYQAGTLNNYLATPNKLFAYLMAGLPIVSSDFPGLSSVVKDEGIGEVFDPQDADSVAKAMTAMMDDRARAEHARIARILAEGEYNWEHESERLLDLYAELSDKG